MWIAIGAAVAQTSVTTYHNDAMRSGVNSAETVLTPANVNSSTFGLIGSFPVDGYIYAQPLYLPGQTIPNKGVHNVVYIATEHNSVYAFDADNNSGSNALPLWKVNFGPSVPSGDVGSYDIYPEIGITSTPVIVPASATSTATLFVVSKTKTLDLNNNPVYKISLHALDADSGAERAHSPIVIQGSVRGTGDGSDGAGNVPFQPLIQNNRVALLYVPGAASVSPPPPPPPASSNAAILPIPLVPAGGAVYIGFASHGDNGPYHGWIFAYNALTLTQTAILNTTPNARTDPSGYPLAAGGIWQSGGGLAYDGSSIYCATGNGSFDSLHNSFGDSILKLSPLNLSVQDYFSPQDQLYLDNSDADLGSGAVCLLPSSAGSGINLNLMVASGKEGSIYLLNRSNLGKFSTSDHIVGELPDVIGGIFGAPAFFNGSVYFGPIYGSLVSIPIAGGAFKASGPTSWTPESFNYPGPTPAISANGTTNGIVWATQSDGNSSGGGAVLHAYLASNLGAELYNSSATNGRDLLGPPVKFSVPTVVNGKVYVGTANALAVFGLGKWTATPSVTPAEGNYPNSVQVTVSDSTPGAVVYYTTDGSVPTQSSTRYTGPVTFTTSLTFSARAFASGYGASPEVQKNYQVNAVIGSGVGLQGYYYNGVQTPGGTFTALRVDPTINFIWNGASPIAGVGQTNWSAQWIGQVQAETTGPYTFYTNSDDGVSLRIGSQTIINDWNDHAPTTDQATVNLVAGQKYLIILKFYQNGGGSVMQLFWSAPGMPMQIVPKTQLYRTTQ